MWRRLPLLWRGDDLFFLLRAAEKGDERIHTHTHGSRPASIASKKKARTRPHCYGAVAKLFFLVVGYQWGGRHVTRLLQNSMARTRVEAPHPDFCNSLYYIQYSSGASSTKSSADALHAPRDGHGAWTTRRRLRSSSKCCAREVQCDGSYTTLFRTMHRWADADVFAAAYKRVLAASIYQSQLRDPRCLSFIPTRPAWEQLVEFAKSELLFV